MIVGVLIILLLAALGMPLFAVIAAVALLGFHQAGYDLIAVAVEYYRLGDKPGLIAIPMFTLAGYLLGESGTPKRLVRLSMALLGWLPGGLAIVAIVACAFFTAFTGASGMTIVAIGAFLYPALTKASYPQPYSLGLVTSSGSLGLLFAPSLPLILFGFVAGQLNTTPAVTVQDLFLAGLLPGALMVLMLSVHAMWIGRHLPKAAAAFDASEVWAAVKDAKWELPLPFIVLGGIYSGQFAASEAAAITTLYVLIVTVLIKREIKLGQLPELMAEAMRLVGAILIILGAATALSNWMVDQEVPNKLFEFSRTYVPFGGDVPAAAERGPVAGRHVHGHILGHRDPDAPAGAGRGRLRHPSSAFRHRDAGQPADRLFHAAGRDGPVHRGVPVQDRNPDPDQGLRPVLPDRGAGGPDHHLVALAVAGVHYLSASNSGYN